MFSPKKALGIGLASAAFLTAGCGRLGTETISDSVVVANGECIVGKSSLNLAPDQALYIGGDLKVDGAGIEDSLKIQNAGKGVLKLVRSEGDEGELRLHNDEFEFSSQANPNEETETDYTIDLNGTSKTSELFQYHENSTSIDIGATPNGLGGITVHLTTICEK